MKPLGEPRPVFMLGLALFGFSIIIDSLYGFLKARPAYQLFFGAQYQGVQNIASFTFILFGVGTVILLWNRISAYGYYGILISLAVFSGIWYGILFALGVY